MSVTTLQVNYRADGAHREPNILRWVSLAHPLVGSSQCLHFPGVLDLGCGCGSLLYQCLEHSLPAFSKLPRYIPLVQALGAPTSDLCKQYSTILEMFTKSKRLSMQLRATSSMSRSIWLIHRYCCMFYKIKKLATQLTYREKIRSICQLRTR